jgi:hypothetical protein
MENKTKTIIIIVFLIGVILGSFIGSIIATATMTNAIFDKAMTIGNISQETQDYIREKCWSHIGDCW